MGELDVESMLLRLPPRKFRDWMFYEQIEPFGVLRDNYHAAVVAKAVMDGLGVKKPGGEAFTYEDFLLKFGEATTPPQRHQTWQQKKSIAQAIVLAYNARAKDL